MGKENVRLDIQDVKQKINVESVGKKLSSMIISNTQEKMEDGNIKIVLILDPKIQEFNHE